MFLLLKKVTLMILLEGFLLRLMIGITKNPSRRIINVTFLSKRTRLKYPTARLMYNDFAHSYYSMQDKLLQHTEIHRALID